MALTFIDRPAVHSTPYPNRPITAVVLHDTETHQTVTTQQSAGGWHWQIDRDGTLYRDCDEDQAAWHVAAFGDNPALNRIPRPAWLVQCPDGAVSDVNYCTIGIELVSDAQYRAAGQPYTTAQYVTLRALLADLGERYGPLPIVGHGELQTDRSDPVAFDWSKVGRTLPVPAVPIVAPPQEAEPMTKEQQDMLDLLGLRQITTAAQLQDLYDWSDEREKEHHDLTAEVASLRKELDLIKQQPAPPAVAVANASLAVRVELSDGRAVVVPLGKGVPSDG